MNPVLRLKQLRMALVAANQSDLAAQVTLVTAADRSGAIPTPVISVAKRVQRLFDALQLDYVVVGGLGMSSLGYTRYTEDVDVLMAPESVQRLKQVDLDAYGFSVVREGSVFVIKDKKYHIEVEILTAGSKLAADQDPLPQVADVRQGSGVSLEGMLRLKLAAFRRKDKNDILALMDKYEDQLDKITKTFTDKLRNRYQALKQLDQIQ